MNILIVEDDELNQRMMEIMLSGKGYALQFASNGLEALEAVRSQSFDLILMDLMMPLMDGFEACRRIREWEAGKTRVPIVALTAYTLEREAQKCFEIGMDDYISKPLKVDRLYQLIEFLVSKKNKSGSHAEDEPSEAAQDGVQILDVESALPIFGNDMTLYKELFGEFIRSLPERLSRMREEYGIGDWKKLSLYAHNLKGLAANFGAVQISAVASTLDEKSRQGQSDIIKETLLALSHSIDALLIKSHEVLGETNEKSQEL
jgi:two-component system sensor histidine kinase/response regulator